jgi:uroporphyrinogen-III decarboxylase
MLKALSCQPTDRVPCSFMSFTALRRRQREDLRALCQAELALGLDAFLFIPSAPRPARPDHPELRGLPIRFHPSVTTREWQSAGAAGAKILHKEYGTPAGPLATSVQLSEDWPHGDHIPFIDDYQIPRMLKPLVASRADLEALAWLLAPPAPGDIAQFQKEAEAARAFAAAQGVLLCGGWGVGMDMANWLCGMQNLMVRMLEDEPFVSDLLEMIHAWNLQRMEVVLAAPVELYLRRAWYEGCDFITPDFYRKAILPRLKKEAALAHARGAKFGCICSSGLNPIVDFLVEAGVDVLLGIDPVQGTHTDFALIRRKTAGRLCLWGGVSGAITVERGTEAEIRQAVDHALQTLGPTGFILSPVDNITVDAPATWQNIEIFLDEWRRHCQQ